MFKCRICGGTWTEIPDDAIEIDLSKRRGARRGALYRFSDGTVHELRKLPSPPIKVEPPVEQELPPVEQIQEVQPPEPEQNLPEQPLVQEVVDEIEDESELTQLTAITTLAHAFRRVNRK